MGVIVGAYAASPCQRLWQPELETSYFSRLSELDGLRGLELPWVGRLHPHDDEWLLAHLVPSWDLVVSDIGGTVAGVADNPRYGLASRDDTGRAAAVRTAQRMRADVDRLNQALARQAVIAVELHSAPLANGGSSVALSNSLEELNTWDWGGAQLLVEHCDTLVEGQEPEKGYLSLKDELAAIGDVPQIGLSLNWGRSAIELRDADRVIDHVVQTRDTGALHAIVFSGAAATDGAFGAAWSDLHLPFAPTPGYTHPEPTSLLTREVAARVLAEAGQLDWIGLKMGWRPVDAPIAEPVLMIAEGIRLIQDAAPPAAPRF